MAHRANVSRRPLGALARERVADAVSARTPLRSLAGAASTPGFARAVAELVAELEAERVEPRRLRGALRAWAGQDDERVAYAEDVSALYDGYRQALERLDRCDGELATARALDALRRAPARWRGTPVVFYGFDDLTALQLDAIETLARVVDAPVTVTLAYEAGRLAFAGRATTFQTLLPLASEHRALPPRAEHYAAASRTPLHHLERCLFERGAAHGGRR
jgi:ATP-dependent helicase/DNAse subunit B